MPESSIVGRRVRRVPMLSGSRVVLVPAGDDDLLIRPPHPPEQIVDAGAAVRDALRFPLSGEDRKSTRLNSSHRCISYAVFCLKKKKNPTTTPTLSAAHYATTTEQ